MISKEKIMKSHKKAAIIKLYNQTQDMKWSTQLSVSDEREGLVGIGLWSLDWFGALQKPNISNTTLGTSRFPRINILDGIYSKAVGWVHGVLTEGWHMPDQVNLHQVLNLEKLECSDKKLDKKYHWYKLANILRQQYVIKFCTNSLFECGF